MKTVGISHESPIKGMPDMMIVAKKSHLTDEVLRCR